VTRQVLRLASLDTRPKSCRANKAGRLPGPEGLTTLTLPWQNRASRASVNLSTGPSRQSKRATPLTRHRPSLRFFEDLVQIPDRNQLFRNRSGPAS
jgi:hypothetical protein